MTFKLNKLNSAILNVIALSCILVTNARANDIPAGFGDLFQIEKKPVDFEDTKGIFHTLLMEVNYNTVFLKDSEEQKKLTKILQDNGVEQSFIENLISDLSNGVENAVGCEGEVDKCVLNPDTYAVVYDYYNNKAYFWINPQYLEVNYRKGEVNYADAYNQNPSLINHFNAYTRFDDESNNFTLNDRIVLGLPYGNVTSELNYQDNDNDFEIDELLYNLEFENYKTQIGYTNNRNSFNATDFLINDVDNGEFAFDFGTSNNLVVDGQKSIQKIFFFAPQTGVLTVYRDDRILLQRNVEQGQGFITNDDLPSGRYTIRMEIRSGSSIVAEQVRAVFNTNSDSLLIGGYDYHITTGVYGRTNTDLLDALNDASDSSSTIDDQVVGEGFARGLIAYRLTNEITLGGGLSGSSAGSYANLGATIYLPFDSELTLSSYLYNDDATQFESSYSLNNWSFSYENFNTSDNENEAALSKYMFNSTDYQKYSISTNLELGQSRYGYLTYNYIDQDGDSSFSGFTSSYLSGGISFPTFADSNIDINASYDFEDDNRDQLSASIVWTIPLSDMIDGNVTVRTTEDEITEFSSGLQTQDLIDDDNIYLSATLDQSYSTYDPVNNTTLTANGSITDDKYSASAYTYLDTDGERSINVNLSSTQVVTKNKAYITRHDADSYLAVNSESNIRFDEETASRGLLVINNNKRQESRRTLYDNEAIIPLRDYKAYSTYLDTESVDLYNLGDKSAQAFSLPGTTIEIKPKLSRIITFISGFKDIFEQSMSNVECVGDGCVSMTEVTDGVYKVSVKEGENFTLNRNDQVCTIPPVDDAKLFNFGENYCFPDIAKLSSTIINIEGENKKVYFIGEFSTNETRNIIDKQIKQLSTDSGFQFLKKEIGMNSYIYAVTDESYIVTAQARSVFNNMSKYANQGSTILKNYALQR